MRVIIVGILVLALGVAAVSTYLIKGFQTPEALAQLEQEKQVPRKFVLVAAKSLALGSILERGDFKWQTWVEEGLNPNYIVNDGPEKGSDADQLLTPFIGAVVRFPIAGGEPILPEKVVSRSQKSGLLSGLLAPGMRAATIKVTEVSSAAGFIFPGDRVDVFLTHGQATKIEDIEARKASGDLETALTEVTETILSDKRVLTIGQMVDNTEKKKAVVAKSITIEVTPKEAQMVEVARTMGKLSLSLRSLWDRQAEETEAEGPIFTTDVETSAYLRYKKGRQMAEAEAEAKAAAAAPKTFAPATRSVTPATIKVFRGQAWATESLGN